MNPRIKNEFVGDVLRTGTSSIVEKSYNTKNVSAGDKAMKF